MPSGRFRFNRVSAEELMFDPSGSTVAPPRAPFMPAKSRPRAFADRSSVRGGSVKLAVQAVLD